VDERSEQKIKNKNDIRGSGSKSRRSLVKIRTFTSFRNRNYRFYYGGMLGQMACMNMQQIPNGLLLERLTGSPVIVGAMSLANAIPMLVLSLFGGVIADRVEKKYVLLLGQASFALISLCVAIALSVGYLSPGHGGSWWVLVVSSAFQGGVMGLAMPSRQAIINDIVSGEELMNAISLNYMGMNALQLVAPTVAGFLIDSFNFASVYYTMTGLYLLSVVFFTFVPRTGIKVTVKSDTITGIKEGFKYVWRHKTIRLLILLSFTAVILSSPYSMLMPFFADAILHVSASGMGLLLSASGAGAMLASLALASLPNRNRGIMMLFGGVFLGLTLIVFAVSSSWILSLLFLALVGIGSTITMTITNTMVQYLVDDSHRGRVMSLFIMQFGLSSFGNFFSGLIAQEFGVQWAVGSFAIVLVLLTVLALVFLPQLRRLD
jgi:MFS family permease